MRIFTLILVIIVLLLGISFAVINAETVTIRYYLGTAQLALSLVIAFALIIGMFVGTLFSISFYIKAKAQQRHLRKQLSNAHKELTNLRKLPLEGQ